MPTKKIQSLRYCRYPLICGIVVSGLLIIRVPIAECFTRAPHEIDSGLICGIDFETEEEPAIAEVSVTPVAPPAEAEQPAAPAADVAAVNTTEAKSPSVEPAVPSIEEAHEALREHAELARGIFQSVPKVLDGVANVTDVVGGLLEPTAVDSTVPLEPEPPAEEPISQPVPEFVIANAADSGGVIHFLVGDDVRSLQPGEELRIPLGEKVHVQFHRGGKFGNTEHWLSEEGTYEFNVSKAGWKLTPTAESNE